MSKTWSLVLALSRSPAVAQLGSAPQVAALPSVAVRSVAGGRVVAAGVGIGARRAGASRLTGEAPFVAGSCPPARTARHKRMPAARQAASAWFQVTMLQGSTALPDGPYAREQARAVDVPCAVAVASVLLAS